MHDQLLDDIRGLPGKEYTQRWMRLVHTHGVEMAMSVALEVGWSHNDTQDARAFGLRINSRIALNRSMEADNDDPGAETIGTITPWVRSEDNADGG